MSQSSSGSSSPLQQLQANLDVFLLLRGREFRARDVPSAHRHWFMKIAGKSPLIDVVREEQYCETNPTKTRKVYELTERATEALDTAVENRETICPCGHGGLRNLPNGHYECLFEPCSAEFTRDELEVRQ